MIDSSLSKMAFSEAYLQAVASAAGFVYEPDRIDLDSIDGTVKGDRALARFDVQVKCTTQAVLRQHDFSFRLRVAHYDQLRDTETSRPLVLVIVIAPRRMEEWVSETEERLLLRRCGYWTSLQGRPPSSNATWQSVRIRRADQFSVAEVKRMMRRVTRGVPIDGAGV